MQETRSLALVREKLSRFPRQFSCCQDRLGTNINIRTNCNSNKRMMGGVLCQSMAGAAALRR